MDGRIAQAEAVGNVVVVVANASMKNFHHVAPHPNSPRPRGAGYCPSPLHLATIRDRLPDGISSRGDVDACSRTSRPARTCNSRKQAAVPASTRVTSQVVPPWIGEKLIRPGVRSINQSINHHLRFCHLLPCCQAKLTASIVVYPLVLRQRSCFAGFIDCQPTAWLWIDSMTGHSRAASPPPLTVPTP